MQNRDLLSDGILIDMPPFSVVYVLADTGSNQIALNDTVYPVVTWNNPADIIYDNPLTPTQLNASANMTGSFVYNPPSGTKLNAGTGIDIGVTFTPADTNYSPVTKTVKINVSKATPLIQWANPSSISYGTALGDTQLDASAVIAGTFKYEPPAGTVLQVGTGQLLQVTFIPADTINYNRATRSVHITVNSVTGLTEHDADQIGIYPVPVADRLNITGLAGFKNNSSVSLQVLSMDGSIVYGTTFRPETDSKTIDIAGLSNGVYMLYLLSDGKRVMKKFVIQK